jgi:hypothetical protein
MKRAKGLDWNPGKSEEKARGEDYLLHLAPFVRPGSRTGKARLSGSEKMVSHVTVRVGEELERCR